MNLKATIAGVIGVTAIAGVLVFNTGAAEKVWNNILELKGKIEAFAKNESALVDKYTALKEEAELKIAELEKKLEDANASASEKEELNNEIARLQSELNKANAAIDYLASESDKIVEEVNELTPTNPDSLPGLNEVEEKSAKAYFYAGKTQVIITPKEDLNIGVLKKGNIVIKFTDANNKSLTKSKIYSGYLNDSQGNKYGKGTENNANYSNQLIAGNTYSTTLTEKSLENEIFPSGIDVDNIVKVEVTITYDNGKVQTETIIKE